MKTFAASLLLLFGALPAAAAIRGTVSPKELAAAINKADAQLVPYRKREISPADIRAVRCLAPDEEPTEFECKWRQRVAGGWAKRKTWLTIDGTGWHVMDA